MRRAFCSGVWAEAAISSDTRDQASPPRATSASTMEWVTRICGASTSGSADTRRLNVCSLQPTNPSGGFFFLTLRCFLGSPAAFVIARAFSMSCSGASAITSPSVSNPARPARPAI